MKHIAWFVMGWFGLLATAEAASFDCTKAKTKIESLICGDDELSKLDETLSNTFQLVIERSEDKQKAIKEQKQWLRTERNFCQDVTCLRFEYQNRISAMTAMPNKTFRDCPNCPEMVLIPAGSFEMGATNGEEDEKPVHHVAFAKPFAIGKTEVTQGEWRAIMGYNKSYYANCGDSCPVDSVGWLDAKEFIEKLNAKTGKKYRLLSEAEWEYACRAGKQQEYCGSNNVESVSWHFDNSEGTPHPVATKNPNSWGLYDMSGNIAEWVEDNPRDNYIGAPVDGRSWKGEDERHVLRGGSWDNDPEDGRAAARDYFGLNAAFIFVGFRLARTIE